MLERVRLSEDFLEIIWDGINQIEPRLEQFYHLKHSDALTNRFRFLVLIGSFIIVDAVSVFAVMPSVLTVVIVLAIAVVSEAASMIVLAREIEPFKACRKFDPKLVAPGLRSSITRAINGSRNEQELYDRVNIILGELIVPCRNEGRAITTYEIHEMQSRLRDEIETIDFD
jgi:hypothetical protein